MREYVNKSISIIKNNFVLQVILFIFIFKFYIRVTTSIADFFDIPLVTYINYIFFLAAVILLYTFLPPLKQTFF